jgi:PAS domain S-box-containing protein
MPRKSLTKELSQQTAQVSLRRILVIPFVLQIVGVVGLVGWLSVENSQRAVNDLAQKLHTEVAARVKQHVDSYLAEPRNIAMMNVREFQLGHLSLENTPALEERLAKEIQFFNNVSRIHVADSRGNFTGIERVSGNSFRFNITNADSEEGLIIYNADNQGQRGQVLQKDPGFKLSNQSWYQSALKNQQGTWSSVYAYASTMSLSIIYSTPLYDRSKKLIGVTGVDLSLAEIGEYLRTIRVGQTGQVFIVDRQGYLIASSIKERPFVVINGQISRLKGSSSSMPLISTAAKYLLNNYPDLNDLRSSQQMKFTVDGVENYLQVTPLTSHKGVDWLILVVVPESDFIQQVVANRNLTIYVCVGAVIFAIVTALATASRILNPIKSLSQAANALSKGEWNQNVDIHSQGELGVLARAFNQMAAQLQNSFSSLEQKETESRRMAQILNEAQRIAHVGSWERDLASQSVVWSEEVLRILGLDPETEVFSYCEFFDKVHPEDRHRVQNIMEEASATGISQAIEYRVIHTDGSIRHIFSKEVYDYNDQGKVVRALGVFMDVSDRKEAELALQNSANALQKQASELEEALTELKRTQTQLIQGEKMSALGQLVAGVAHEINNPVNFIYGNISHARIYANEILQTLEMYQKDCPNPSPALAQKLEDAEISFVAEDLPKILDSMQIGAERIREIVKSLRSFSRLDEAEMKAVDIHDGIDSTLMILQNRLKPKSNHPGIIINKQYGNLPMVECYAGQLNQVFMNIISNALDALDAASEQNCVEQPQITIQTSVHQDHIEIKISDNGTGIQPELVKRLFDPFFTTKPVGKGTGLGLAISHSIIVEKHNGSLVCHSEVGVGTEFTITIPLKQTKAVHA